MLNHQPNNSSIYRKKNTYAIGRVQDDSVLGWNAHDAVMRWVLERGVAPERHTNLGWKVMVQQCELCTKSAQAGRLGDNHEPGCDINKGQEELHL